MSPVSAEQIEMRRQRLYNELAEEFSTFDRLGSLVRRVAGLVKPSVIHIEAHKVQGKGASAESFDEAGSGVVLSIAGQPWVLTNRHVIHGASASQISMRTSDGRRWQPGRILMDASTDVAVMQLMADRRSRVSGNSIGMVARSGAELPPIARQGDSRDVQIGDFVIAIGSPFGLSHSVTFGIVSAKGRRDLSLGEERIDLQDFFQTDAAINPGNSGGPLLNLRGEVVALNTAIASSSGGSEGIGFAIPINMAIRVAEELIAYGQLRRAYLGVTLDPEFALADLSASRGMVASMKVSPESDSASSVFSDAGPRLGGARVKEVRAGSPAASIGLQRGDVILQFNSRLIEDDDHLVACVGLAPIESPIDMVILREGTRYRSTVQLTQLP
ncbi:MAG: trypsin-like peptidase domain-containing protein [Planctomycetota bacterium]